MNYLLGRWDRLAARAGLQVEILSEEGGYPVVALTSRRPAEGEQALYLSAGIHGDEAAGVVGLLEWAEHRLDILSNCPLVILPCMNPWGLAENTRIDQAGRDLNRSFDNAALGLIAAWRRYLEGRDFGLAAMLHEDYEAQGCYLYELGRRGEAVGEELLSRVDEHLPRHRGRVDGRPIRKGVYRRTSGVEKIAREIDGMPEAIALHQHHARIALTFETPSEFSLYRRVRAQVSFLEAVARMAWPG